MLAQKLSTSKYSIVSEKEEVRAGYSNESKELGLEMSRKGSSSFSMNGITEAGANQ